MESVATYHPSPSSPSILDDERGACQDEQSYPFPAAEEDMDLQSQGDQEDQTFHAAKISVGKRGFLSRVKRFGGRVRKLFKPRAGETRSRVSTRKPPPPPPVSLRLSESPKNRQGTEARYFIPRRFSLQSLLHSRLPPGSDDSNSRATADNRLSTVVSVSAHEDRLSLQDTRLLDATTADVLGIVYHDVHPERDYLEQKAEET